MREFAAVASVLFGFSLFSFAVPARRPKRWQSVQLPPALLHAAGFGGFALAAAVLWSDGASYALLFTTTAGCAAATFLTLAFPVLLKEPSTSAVSDARVRERTKSLVTFRPSTLALIILTLVGTVPGSILLGLGLTLRLPFALESRLAIGFGLIIAFWLTGVCLVWLSKSGLRALGWCCAFAAIGGLLVGKLP